ncbi:PROTAMINE P1 FAMILY PROTEIN [Salix purpurea]|uniref:PROTAMINE P1 FAMILY PROTEIN n=1 Tax=Salix purpurea TaxID=77065 RepID=A0A9Q0Q387_SALPP|nr:PROTAMINE P1 FAMILY PROTEIN [Salix purpurea]
MKLSAKPISSPGRTDKYYPPPLMRFLRSNVGSRSRGRSRSSPMFVRKKNTAIETQEPSSPKVTCMGQVRVRRSKQANTRPGKSKKRRCKWIHKTLLCHHHFNRRKLKLKSFRPSWSKWAHFFRVGIERKNKIGEESSSSKVEPKIGVRSDDFEQEREGEEMEPQVYVSTENTPPRNAFLLTRCRSAPYRSSSLAGRFWGSPSESEETEQKQRSTPQENRENGSPISKRESVSEEPDQQSSSDPETEVKISHFKEFEGSIASIRERTANIEESKTEKVSTALPLVLTRCKSEPARTSEKLDPVVILWKKRRLGFT